ncbi:molybdopterin-dependent oxidoreductase [Rhodoferax saidenbachensis]|nr:molybdopterin-dependent oxidoreductase [Rhodoferax saidenbachensis]
MSSTRSLFAAAVLAASALCTGPVLALEPATGKVVLTVSGKVAAKNTAQAADFDMAMLEAMPQKTFTTLTPWDRQPIKFSGPLLRDVLAAAKASGTTLKAVAVNDYSTTIPLSDTQQFDMVLATRMNGQPIPPRTKGPLFIVYPYDSQPTLQAPIYKDRSAWQLRSLLVE